MDMMLIYRIEHKETGKGPYQHREGSHVNLINQFFARDSSTTPMPQADIPELISMSFRAFFKLHYGFDSLDKLFDWFDVDVIYKVLHDNGFQVSVYKVPKDSVKVGKKQVAFMKDDAKLVDSLTFY